MEIIRRPTGGTLVKNSLALNKANHRRKVSLELRNELGNFVKPQFKSVETGPYGSAVYGCLTGGSCLPVTAFEYGVKPSWLPAEGNRQRFKGSRATAALHAMSLDFAHDGRRHLRTLRELPLAPAKLTNALVDGPGNGSPVFRHAFRHARPSAFRFQRRG